MQLTKIDTIPSGIVMVERAEIYMDTAGTYYVVFRPSPAGVDGPYRAYVSTEQIQLGAADPIPDTGNM